jgi:hypothetical protein
MTRSRLADLTVRRPLFWLTVSLPLLWHLLPWINLVQQWARATGPCWIYDSGEKFLTSVEAALLISPFVTGGWVLIVGVGAGLTRLRFAFSVWPFWTGAAVSLLLVVGFSAAAFLGYLSWYNGYYFALYRMNCP